MRYLNTLALPALLCLSAPLAAQQAWQLDISFGGSGRLAVPFDLGGGDTDIAVKVLAYPPSMGGKLLLVGHSTHASGSKRVTLARLLADGSLDSSFGIGGKVAKDACMSQVRDAAFDSQYRIVVVGDTSCSGNATQDAAVVRFTANGADDTSFAGDGGINLKFKPNFDGQDSGHAVLVLDDDSLLIGGGYKSTSRETGMVQRVLANGTVAAGEPAQTVSASHDRRVIAGLRAANGKSVWLIQDNSTMNSPGAFWRIDNSSLQRDTSFEPSTGERGIVTSAASGYSACPGALTGSHVVTSLTRVGSTLKAFGYANGSPVRAFFAGVDESDGAVRKYGCLDIGGSPVRFIAQSAATSADGRLVYLAGSCNSPSNLCLWRLSPRTADLRELQPDVSFNAGAPASASFLASPGVTPTSEGLSLVHSNGQSVVAGYRHYVNADTDFAVARFGAFSATLFRNGFEAN